MSFRSLRIVCIRSFSRRRDALDRHLALQNRLPRVPSMGAAQASQRRGSNVGVGLRDTVMASLVVKEAGLCLGVGLLEMVDGMVVVARIDLKPHEADAEFATGDGRRAEAGKRIEDDPRLRDAVEADTPPGQFDRKRRGVRPVGIPVLDRRVGNDPHVASTATIVITVTETIDVRLVLERRADGKSVKGDGFPSWSGGRDIDGCR